MSPLAGADRDGVRGSALLVATTLLVVLAGCSALAGGGEPTPADTVTPAPVPDPGPTDTPAPSTPGERLGAFPAVSAGGTVNATGLYAAHVDYLSSHSYTLSWERRTAGGDGAITREYDRRIAVGPDGSFLVRNEDGGTNLTLTYGDRDGAYRRVVAPDGTAVSPATVRSTGPAGERYAEAVSFEVLAFVETGYDSVDAVTRDGRTYARIVSDHVPPEIPETYSAYAVHDFRATLWVAPEGYVRAVHYEFVLRNVDERIAVEWRYTYDRVGETTVDRPGWVPDAATDRSATAAPSSTVTPSGTAGPPPTASPSPTPTADPARVPPETAANVSAGG
ncbi:DUF7537 family lipoprotein [Halosimplex halophilum]|uniref:DUF7537 family lipoprotein n=1 Tax=Halosimplex halophilum TaxID=2559572 RepID=UPI00107FC578|nr:hypothetical protein [Halosimplex halophilum]